MGRARMSARQKPMARAGTRGTRGQRNGRGSSGLVLRSTIIPNETITNAARVPIFTSSAMLSRGSREARSAVTAPTRRLALTGVRNFGWTFAKLRGSRPSRAMAKKMRDWP